MSLLKKLKTDVVGRQIIYTYLSSVAGLVLCAIAGISLLLGQFLISVSSIVLIGVVSVSGECLRRKANQGLAKEGNGKIIPPMLITKLFIKE